MAAKKSAKKAAKTVAPTEEKKPAKKAVAKKAAKKAPAASKPAAKASEKKSPPPVDAVAREAYLVYRRRVDEGLPGDSHGDWLEAERQLSKTE